jgi:hypothetical protein
MVPCRHDRLEARPCHADLKHYSNNIIVSLRTRFTVTGHEGHDHATSGASARPTPTVGRSSGNGERWWWRPGAVRATPHQTVD